MLGTTFYNESIRKALVSFGTLFNNITIQRVDSSNNTQNILVPLAYAPRARFRQLVQAATGVEYHELYHAVEETMLTNEQIQELNNETIKIVGESKSKPQLVRYVSEVY